MVMNIINETEYNTVRTALNNNGFHFNRLREEIFRPVRFKKIGDKFLKTEEY